MEDLCDNIGLVLVCIPSGSTDVAASPSQYMIQPSGIPILSPVLLCMLAIPILFLLFKFEGFLHLLVIYMSMVNFTVAVGLIPDTGLKTDCKSCSQLQYMCGARVMHSLSAFKYDFMPFSLRTGDQAYCISANWRL